MTQLTPLQKIRKCVQRLGSIDPNSKLERGRVIADILSLLDEAEKPPPQATFNYKAVALLLSAARESKKFKNRRKYHVGDFAKFDELVDYVRSNNPNFEDITLGE